MTVFFGLKIQVWEAPSSKSQKKKTEFSKIMPFKKSLKTIFSFVFYGLLVVRTRGLSAQSIKQVKSCNTSVGEVPK